MSKNEVSASASNDETLIEEWLSECRTSETRRLYSRQIKKFQDWYKKPLSEFLCLDFKQMRNIALKFQNEQKETGIPVNSINSMVIALCSFARQNGKIIDMKGKRLRTQIDLTSHIFTNGDLTSMFDVADTQGKAILTTFTSLGWEVSAILNLKRCYINSLIEKARADKKTFVYRQDQRGKTGEPRFMVLNPLAIEWLEKWFHEWKGETIFEIQSEEGLNRIMKVLAKEAQIKTTGRIHSHLIRKWVMSGLSRAGFNEFQIKYILGKHIGLSDSTYLQNRQQEIEERYPEAYQKYLTLKPEKTSDEAKIKEMGKTIEQKYEAEIKSLKSEIEGMKKFLLANFSKTFESPEEEAHYDDEMKENDKKTRSA